MSTPDPRSVGEPPAHADRLHVTDMSRSLGFYLDLNCEVREADDRWVLLRCGRVELVLVHTPTADNGPVPATPPLRLPTCDVRAVHRQQTAGGVRVGPLTRPAGSLGQFETADPDRHRLVIDQAGSTRSGSRSTRLEQAPPLSAAPPSRARCEPLTDAAKLPTRASRRRREHG